MMNEFPKRTLLIAAAIALFLAFLTVRGVVDQAQSSTTPTQEYYDGLAQALDRTGLIPWGTYDGVVLAAARVVAPDDRFGDMWDSGNGIQQYYLGPVLTLYARDGNAHELQINVREWTRLPVGPLREAVRPFDRLDLTRQQLGAQQGRQTLGGPAPNFSFTSRLGVQSLRFTPYFDQDRCVAIKVQLMQ